MVKYLNNKNPLIFGFSLTFTLILIFSVLINSQEKYNPLIATLWDSIWYVFITVMTIGFGEISAQSMWGKISMTIATFLGIMFTSIFVVCVQKFLIFDESQGKAYLMLTRCYYKEIMKQNALSFFTI